MQVAIHKKKMVKRYTFPDLKGTVWFGSTLLIEELLRTIESGQGYKLVAESDFIGELIENQEFNSQLETGHYIYVNDELKKIEHIVHTFDGIVCVIDVYQEEEDEITERQKNAWNERLKQALSLAEERRKTNEKCLDLINDTNTFEPKKSWLNRLLG